MMNTKQFSPISLYLISGFLGGITSVLLLVPWFVAEWRFLEYGEGFVYPGDPLVNLFTFAPFEIGFCVTIPAAILGAILGIVLARKMYAAKPAFLTIFLGAGSGGLLGSCLIGIWAFCFLFSVPILIYLSR